jgi:hypothetical protein
LKHSLKFQDLEECLKVELVHQANQILLTKAQKNTQSRLSIITGLRRREIDRILDGVVNLSTPRNLVTKILGLWQAGATARPKKYDNQLTFLGTKSQFTKLVAEISTDLNPATVIFELKRVGAIEKKGEYLRLLASNYVDTEDPSTGYEILENDLTDLTKVVEENVLNKASPPNHHLRTEFDRVRGNALPRLKVWFLKQGHKLHKRARAEIAKYDQDVNPAARYEGSLAKVSFTSFSLSESIPAEESHDTK